jgi:multiple sugar transport system permease protein
MAAGLSERLPATEKPGLAARMRRATWKGQRIDWSAYVFILPFFASFLIFLVAPILFGGYVSFTEWGIVGDPKWIGLENFTRAFSDPWVPKIWGNTLK